MTGHLDLAMRKHARNPVHRTDERVHERRRRRVVDARRRIELFDPATVEDGHAVGQFQRFFLIVGHEHRGQAGLLVQFAQPAAQVAAHLCIQGTKGLVQQQHARLNGYARASATR